MFAKMEKSTLETVTHRWFEMHFSIVSFNLTIFTVRLISNIDWMGWDEIRTLVVGAKKKGT